VARGPDFFQTDEPTGDAADWGKTTKTRQGGVFDGEYETFEALECPTATFCMATSTLLNPYVVFIGPGSWSVADGVPPFATCSHTLFCLTADSGGVRVSTSPSNAASWSAYPTPSEGDETFGTGRTCVADGTLLCVASGFYGGWWSSTNPAGGTSTWKHVDFVRDTSEPGTECPTTDLCLLWDAFLGSKWVGDTRTPASTDASGWQFSEHVAGPEGSSPSVIDVSCPTRARCFAVNTAGEVIVGTGPEGAAPQPPDDGDPPGGGGNNNQPKPFASAFKLKGSYTVASGNAITFLVQVTGANARGIISGTTTRSYSFAPAGTGQGRGGGGGNRGRALAAKKAKKKKVKIGKVNFQLQADVPKKVTLKLSKPARKLLGQLGKYKVNITVKLTSDTGAVTTQKQKVTLKAAAKKKKKKK
jgi:hypothetical protein